ncbi:uncharacterized protein LOC134827942 isoform X1 [Culicoides brevitarsis]|uniref:uncharacterized protein LOC134827942 isoform X1 n=1 Tax=Culicoides brevitarsis TaxID=469753 RepID=UPI00307B4964
MSQKLPKFLNKSYLERILQQNESDSSISVENFECKPAVAAGNNYASQLLRTTVKYKKDGKCCDKSLIIKTVVADEEMAKVMVESGIFKKELIMYDRILPKFQKLLKSIGDTEKLYSPAVFVDYENSTIIFNDLKQEGYELGDRLNGCDVDHIRLLTRKIAKFHACSMILMENGEEDFADFQEQPLKEDTPFENFFFGMFDACVEELKTWPGYEKYVKKMEKLRETFMIKSREMFVKSKTLPNVLAHGDLWVNNMMFKYNKETRRPEDLVLIDFQVGYIGPPVIDLMYFTLTSTHLDIKLNRNWEIIAMYQDNLAQILQKFGFKGKIPTLFEIQCQRIERQFYEILALVAISPVILNEQEDHADLEGLVGDSLESKQFKEQMFKNSKFIKTLKHFLPIWDKMGLLDPLH